MLAVRPGPRGGRAEAGQPPSAAPLPNCLPPTTLGGLRATPGARGAGVRAVLVKPISSLLPPLAANRPWDLMK